MTRKPAQASKPRDEGKARFELRFDDDLYAAIKEAAEAAEISVNQLMQGIARWAMKHAHPGEEPYWLTDDLCGVAQPGCIWFGHSADVEEDRWGEMSRVPPTLYFSLDFTERHVVREPDSPARNEDPES